MIYAEFLDGEVILVNRSLFFTPLKSWSRGVRGALVRLWIRRPDKGGADRRELPVSRSPGAIPPLQ